MLVIAPLHGNGTMIRDFTVSGLVELLASRTRGVCFDGLGFGYNQWPRSSIWIATTQAGLFVNALNELGMRNPVVLSHSWGTLVAVALALRTDYPIRGLVLASGYYLPTSRWDVWINVRSADAGARRSRSLHSCPDHLMGPFYRDRFASCSRPVLSPQSSETSSHFPYRSGLNS